MWGDLQGYFVFSRICSSVQSPDSSVNVERLNTVQI